MHLLNQFSFPLHQLRFRSMIRLLIISIYKNLFNHHILLVWTLYQCIVLYGDIWVPNWLIQIRCTFPHNYTKWYFNQNLYQIKSIINITYWPRCTHWSLDYNRWLIFFFNFIKFAKKNKFLNSRSIFWNIF